MTSSRSGFRSGQQLSSVIRAPWSRARWMIAIHILWAALCTFIILWWGSLILSKSSRIAELEKQVQPQSSSVDDVTRTQRMLRWEGGTFLVLILTGTAALIWLDRRDARRARSLQAFFASVTHELRTPLTILQGRLEDAVNKSDNPAVQAELSALQDEVGRLSGITRKLLLLSQADAGRLALHVGVVDVSGMLAELLIDAEMLLGGQKLSTVIQPHLMTRGDALLLRQLFNNLISNAVRYCAPGGAIAVTARSTSVGTEVTFRNACNPISSESRACFFDRFYRGDASHNRAIEGNGLGLSLAREIARAHGGDLSLQSSAEDEVVMRLLLPAN